MSEATGHTPAGNEGVESEGIDAGQLLNIVVISSIVIGILVTAAVFIVERRFETARVQATEQTGYPLLQETEMNGLAKLNRYEVVDAESKIYRIPIERAMQQVVEESE